MPRSQFSGEILKNRLIAVGISERNTVKDNVLNLFEFDSILCLRNILEINRLVYVIQIFLSRLEAL